MNEFRICDRCKKTNIKSLIPKLNELDPNASIIVGCQNLCGIGGMKSFVIVNHVPIIAPNEDALIDEIKKKLDLL